jgi:hypothetical protein
MIRDKLNSTVFAMYSLLIVLYIYCSLNDAIVASLTRGICCNAFVIYIHMKFFISLSLLLFMSVV